MVFIKNLFSLAALQRPGAGLFLSLLRLLWQGFHCLDCSYWPVSLFGPFFLVGLVIYVFCARFFWPIVNAVGGFFSTACCALWAGMPQAYPFKVIFEGCFLTFFSIDTILLIIV
jgi:hypothetical protein